MLGFAAVFAVVVFDHAPPVLAEPTDAPLQVRVDPGVHYADASGKPLIDVSEAGGTGERIITGRTESGAAARVVVQSALDVDLAEPEVARVPPSTIARGNAARGILPAEMVGTDFTEGERPVEQETFTAAELQFDTGALRPTFIAGTTPTSIAMAWKPVTGAVSFTVTREGRVLSKGGDAPMVTETGLSSGHQYRYEILSYDAEGQAVATKSVPVTTLSSGVRGSIGTQSYQAYTTAFLYKTFIPNAKVNTGFFATVGCGLAGKSGWGFRGDNRGYRVPTASAPWSPMDHRTMMFVNVNWDNPAPYDVITAKHVGATHVLDDKNAVRDSRTASAAGMTFKNTYKSGSYAQSVLSHKVGNPFCITGAITYDATVRLYRSGTIEVVGSRFPVPHHELYGRWSNNSGAETWRTIARHDNRSFDCLTGQCGRATTNVSKTY